MAKADIYSGDRRVFTVNHNRVCHCWASQGWEWTPSYGVLKSIWCAFYMVSCSEVHRPRLITQSWVWSVISPRLSYSNDKLRHDKVCSIYLFMLRLYISHRNCRVQFWVKFLNWKGMLLSQDSSITTLWSSPDITKIEMSEEIIVLHEWRLVDL